MSMSVSLLKTAARPNFINFFVHLARGFGSILFWAVLQYVMYFQFCGLRHFVT